MLFTADAHHHNAKRFIVGTDEKLTAFLELERFSIKVRKPQISYPMITRLIIAVAVALFFTPAIPLLAGEHPRNLQIPPSILPNAAGQPQRSTQTTQVSKADISTGIKKHIQSETKKSSDKKFHVNYQGKDLALNLVTVHDDRLSDLGRGKYFACVDMKATDGKTYDIDFFLTGQPGSMKVTETSVHKVNGKPLYDWKEEGGIWKKVRVS